MALASFVQQPGGRRRGGRSAVCARRGRLVDAFCVPRWRPGTRRQPRDGIRTRSLQMGPHTMHIPRFGF